MKFIFLTLKKILFWSYERGTWQYDVMCVLILAFVFGLPNTWLENRKSPQSEAIVGAMFVSREELGPVEPNRLTERVGSLLEIRYGHPLTISRVNPQFDASGHLTGYAVYAR